MSDEISEPKQMSGLVIDDIDVIDDRLDVTMYTNYLSIRVEQYNQDCLVNISKQDAKVLRDWLINNVDMMEEESEE